MPDIRQIRAGGLLLRLTLVLPVLAMESCKERLTLHPVSMHHFAAHVSFECYRESSSARDFTHFSRTLGRLAEITTQREFLARLTRGRWHSTWNAPILPDHTLLDSPPGAELMVHFNQSTPHHQTQWELLVEMLSGLMCTSFDLISKHYVFPISSEFGDGVMYGAVGRESMCSENLTPWVKLLPCGGQAGIASLLSPLVVFNSTFHSLSLHLQRGQNGALTVNHNLTAVLPLGQQLLPPYGMLASQPTKITPFPRLPGCAAMSESTVAIPLAGIQSNNLGELPFLFSERLSQIMSSYTPLKYLKVLQQIVEVDNLHGKLALHLHTGSMPQTATLLQVVPWWLRLHMHTLTTTCKRVSQWHVVTSEDRVRAAQFEATLELTSNQSCVVVIQFERAFMWLDEYPPDPSRGVDIPAALIHTADGIRLYSTSSLVMLPKPDFSMPFNVITYVFTMLALYSGSVIKLVIYRFQKASTDGKKQSKLFRRITSFFRRSNETHACNMVVK